MSKLAVFYHCKLSGHGMNEDWCVSIMTEQMHALTQSGLAASASEIHLGINGGDGDALLALALAPKGSVIHVHGPEARTEIPTLNVLRDWLPSHPDWYVLYHHIKGITHPGQPLFENWRRRIEGPTVWGWRRCVADLSAGAEACGCHWLTKERFPGQVSTPFFGGTFWWASAKYLLQLPPLPPATWENRYEAESWIGKRVPYPRIVNYIEGWP